MAAYGGALAQNSLHMLAVLEAGQGKGSHMEETWWHQMSCLVTPR